ncbi:uncharacterized protein mpp4b isoform X2 [Puntigrus tetrazona]|uniref:uncharacterized protein mpp4b isoform X2 n=1 Tax=Puntigrus tetrazona TaxID=1606681 RepID=UPI001C8A70A4|nr:uncharacterized protein mpp4b isoform X2 [Puntigrus tetrazona]
MRPDVETDPGSAPLEMGDKGLTQILAHVIAEVRGSVSKDINGAELLYSLLNAPWLQSLLKVYECLQRQLKGPARPYLSYSSGLSLQILSDLLAVQNPSNEARELYALLSHPHLQALLSAHDTVSLRDYEPDLPPLPKDLPEDEEAMRIVCLVKNNQPLTGAGREFQSHWDTIRHATHFGLFSTGRRLAGNLDAMLDGSTSTKTSPSVVAPTTVHHCNTLGSCHQSKTLWKQSLSSSTPCVCSSVVIDDSVDNLDSGDESDGSSMLHTFSQPSPWISSSSCFHAFNPSLKPCKTTLHARTAPPSPMHCHRVRETITCSHTRPAKEEGLNQLRNTLQQATSCMERSSENVHLLGERMAAATERVSESVQENSQALAMLTHVVEKLQELVSTSHTTTESSHGTETASRVVNRMASRSFSVPNSPAVASSSRFSHYPGSSSSSSSSSAITLLEQPTLSKGKSFNAKTNPSPSSQRRQVDVQHRMTNGSLSSSPAQNRKLNSNAFRCFFSQKKKKSKKKE